MFKELLKTRGLYSKFAAKLAHPGAVSHADSAKTFQLSPPDANASIFLQLVHVARAVPWVHDSKPSDSV